MKAKPQQETSKPQVGDLRVWWIPQVPGKSFEVLVPDAQTAGILVDALASYDLFQYEHNIKPDYCNTGGVQVYEGAGDNDDGWTTWYSDDGDEFGEWLAKNRDKWKTKS